VATVGVGVDVVDVPRFADLLERRPAIAERLFTEQEQADAKGDPARLAARFAAKEAVLKTFKVGVGAASWRDIEVVRAASGAPSISLHTSAQVLATNAGVTTLHLSLSHSESTAIAMVVGEG
jgi:holo-[acyl-carrier protein] synthase